MKPQPCWMCGERAATQLIFGYPLCDECIKDAEFDSEEFEDYVVGRFVEGNDEL